MLADDLNRFLAAFTRRLQAEAVVLKSFKGYYSGLGKNQRVAAIDYLLKTYRGSTPSRGQNTPHPFIIKAVIWATGGDYFKVILDGVTPPPLDINDFKEHILIPIFQALEDNKNRFHEKQATELQGYVESLRKSPHCRDYREELLNMAHKFEAIAYEQFSEKFQHNLGQIEADASAVKIQLDALGFSKDLADCIDELEERLHGGKSGFDFAAAARTSRAFLESLHKQAAQKLGGMPGSWGKATAELRAKEVISEPLEKYVASLYTAISDHGVHPTVSSRGLRAVTINRKIASLNSFYVWAVHCGVAPISPLNGIRKLKVPRRIPKFLTFEDTQKLLAYTGSLRRTATVRGKQVHAMISILYYLGLRREELVSIRYEHIEKITEGEIYLHVFGKRDKQRMVPFAPPAFEAYQKYNQFRPEYSSPFVFVSLRTLAPLSK